MGYQRAAFLPDRLVWRTTAITFGSVALDPRVVRSYHAQAKGLTKKEQLMPSRMRLFRLFVSSTFNDFTVERNALHDEVFPRLERFCRERDARFQAVDLRWGVSEEAGRDQQTLEICFQEIRRCQCTTARPNFIALLGGRYGWRPLPPRIGTDEFLALCAALSASGRNVLKRWYRHDINALSPCHVLRPIADQAAWEEAERELRSLLREAVAAQCWANDDPGRLKFEASATHHEILHGLLQPPADAFDPRGHVCCYLRTLELPARIEGDSPARGFADYVADLCSGGLVRDADATARLERLREQIRHALPTDQVYDYPAQWTGEGITFDVQALCRRLEADLQRQISAELQRLERTATLPGGEVARVHIDIAAERARNFVGRRPALVRIAAYLVDAAAREPLVIVGPAGVGKTALLARAAHNVGPGCLLVQRYLGVTPDTSSLRTLLAGVCHEIAAHTGSTADDLGNPVGEWAQRLSQAADRKPVVLFLDALDQLSPAGNAHSLSWLPRPLPPGVKVVASVLEADGEAGACARAAEALISPERRLRLEPLSAADGADLLECWLQEAGRCLQPLQWQALAPRLAQCGLPLYIRALFQEARRWASYDEVPRDLAGDTAGLLRQLFDRLEERRHHSPVLVRHCLGYLAASRHGLMEFELLAVLSDDTEVMQDFHDHSPT